jgi:hypothetical protein
MGRLAIPLSIPSIGTVHKPITSNESIYGIDLGYRIEDPK